MPLDNTQSYIEAIAALTGATSVCVVLPERGVVEQSNSIGWGPHSFAELAPGSRLMSPTGTDKPCHVSAGANIHSLRIAVQIDSKKVLEETLEGFERWLWAALHFDGEVPTWVSEAASDHRVLPKGLLPLLKFGGRYLKTSKDYRAILVDPLTSLPGRVRFQTLLAELLEQHNAIAVLMVHCADFQQVNRKFGHAAGDQVIAEIAERLSAKLNADDHLSRFGGALFALAMPTVDESAAVERAQRLQQALQQGHYLNGAMSLAFNIGLTLQHQPADVAPAQELLSNLLNRTDQALKTAQSAEQPCVTLWQSEHAALSHQQADYIGGIFTSDTATDYRNMLLLWDLSNLIASRSHPAELLEQAIERLGKTFDFEFGGVALFGQDETLAHFDLFLLRANQRPSPANASEILPLPQLSQQLQQARKAFSAATFEAQNRLCFAAPLGPQDDGVLLLAGQSDQFSVPHDVMFLLSGLAKQLGRALSRAREELARNEALTQRQSVLENELKELKATFSGDLFYRSEPMVTLMAKAKRAAMTDTTTLVIGESGTGKERLVHALHSMSPRKDKPLVIVDCGSIPDTLIESELFGHVKGAFTGALAANTGKVAEADGGTLMLDEIGELPLQMQTKLLRFVQEKQFSPVGSARSQSVDVKIIAVTNRELENEVYQGRFRQDLFYRLNILSLRTPPLRERTGDIELLAKHFLRKFATQFNEPLKSLSDTALEHMTRYQWPGNVRELENRLMQACLMTEGAMIEWSALNVDDSMSDALMVSTEDAIAPAIKPEEKAKQPEIGWQSTGFDTNQLMLLLEEFCRTAVANMQPVWPPLEHQVIVNTLDHTQKQVNALALNLGMSVSTARRRVDRVNGGTSQPAPVDPQHELFNYLVPLYQGKMPLGHDGLKALRLRVLSTLMDMVSNHNHIAKLMGVSEPTIYKWKKELQEPG